jgi:hypothetical protein
MRASKLGRNQPCPCGSKSKYKDCCFGKIDWPKLLAQRSSEAFRHLSLRGKNMMFINAIAGSLQFDSISSDAEYKDLKRACSPAAVKEIYSVIPEIWPDLDDYERCIQSEAGKVAALYIGDYEPAAVFSTVTRLSLYCDRIYLVDPFMNAQQIREEYSPLVHPEQYRATTIKFIDLWMTLSPWIDAGIVAFIRPLHDFVPGLFHEVLTLERRHFDENPNLKIELEKEVAEQIKRRHATDGGAGEMFVLMTPDKSLREFYRKMLKEAPDDLKPPLAEDDFMAYIQRRRDEHPYFVERLPGQTAEIHLESSGASYELAKRMCSVTNSHIVTSLRTRWKEIELDRESAGIDLQRWSPFAKALHESDLKILNAVPMKAALRLREENRLESLRLFFRKIWKTCRDPDEFSDINALNLSVELHEEVAKANDEWQKIDQQLLKWLGATGAAVISSGLVGFVPAASAAAVTGVTGLIQSRMKRTTFKERYPAGFFLGLKEN